MGKTEYEAYAAGEARENIAAFLSGMNKHGDVTVNIPEASDALSADKTADKAEVNPKRNTVKQIIMPKKSSYTLS